MINNYEVSRGISLNNSEENLECIEPIVKDSIEEAGLFDRVVTSDFVFDAESRYIYFMARGGSLHRVKTDGTGNLTNNYMKSEILPLQE